MKWGGKPRNSQNLRARHGAPRDGGGPPATTSHGSAVQGQKPTQYSSNLKRPVVKTRNEMKRQTEDRPRYKRKHRLYYTTMTKKTPKWCIAKYAKQKAIATRNE